MARPIRHTDTDPGWINRRLRAIEKRQAQESSAKRLAHSSIPEDYTLTPEGPKAATPMPLPQGLTITAGIERVKVVWSGSGTSPMPPEFGRLAVHASKQQGYTPTQGTEVATVSSPYGGTALYAADGGDTYFVRCAIVSLRGDYGDFTDEVEVTVEEAADPDTFEGDIVGGSISIATAQASDNPETFSGSTFPAGWTVVNDYPNPSSVPGLSVTSTGVPTGSDNGSAMLLDHGPTDIADGSIYRGWAITDAPEAVDAEVVTRFQYNIDPRDNWLGAFELTHVFLRMTGSFYDGSNNHLSVALSGEPRAVLTVDGSYSSLGLIEASPRLVGGAWYNLRVRAVGARMEVSIWEDGTPEPEPSLFHQTQLLEPGLTGVYYNDSELARDPSIGLDTWFDTFDVTTYATGFAVYPDGAARVSTMHVHDQLSAGFTEAATSLGSVTRRMAVRDEAGAVLGYVPLYDDIA